MDLDNSSYIIRDCIKYSCFDLISKNTVFHEDNNIYIHMRNFINDFISNTIKNHNNHLILDCGPKDFKPTSSLLINNNIIETVDIMENSLTTYVCDLTDNNLIPKNRFDAIYCLEVIEHCSDPLELLKQMKLLLKSDGFLYLSFPFQFRLHGPIPDNWRISEFGMRILLEKAGLHLIEMKALINNNRPAFPISYTIICKKNNT
jgi:SAM-dependent methyltransferase